MLIYKNNYLTILLTDNKYIFMFRDYNNNKDIIKTFLKNLPNKYDKEEILNITIYAEEINTLESLDILNIEKCQEIFLFLMKQIKELEKYNLTIINYALKDILYFKINGKYSFYYLNNKHISPIKDGRLLINKLFIKNEFSSPELNNIKEIPNNKLFKQTSYWSLAKIIIHCLKKIDKNLEDIKYSRLYWSLERCLKENPLHRYLIFI